MSIEKTQSVNAASTVQSRDSSEAPAAKARPVESKTTEAAGTQVVLSNAQSQLMKPGSQDINTARVEQLKTAIRNGELKMDTGKIADALIQEAKSSLQDN